MSFVIAMYVREGIVMASDSRLSLNVSMQQDGKQVVQNSVGLSDSTYKTFLAPKNIGISTFGSADIKGVPISGYIDSFIAEVLSKKDKEVDEVPNELNKYFGKFDPIPKTGFVVGGYKTVDGKREQHIWFVNPTENECKRANDPTQQGAQWGGEPDILTRLLQPLASIDNKGNIVEKLPTFQIPYQFFTLQDAIDFSIFAVRSTIEAIRFQPRPKTVGGPIDVLAIKPDEAFWVQRKELHV